MPEPATTARRSRRRMPAQLDPILDKSGIAEALSVSRRTVERILSESAASRAGLWPQLVHRGRPVVRASVVDAYIAALPCLEDAPPEFAPRR